MGISDKIGQIFGRLTVLNKHETLKNKYLCRCSCGELKLVSGTSLQSGKVKSCGCLFLEAVTKHSQSKTREYFIWNGIKQKCLNESGKDYLTNGASGVSLCKDWEDFSVFLSDMGFSPSKNHQILRVDKNKGFQKDNCLWSLKNNIAFQSTGHKNTSSKYKGVTWSSKRGHWVSTITKDGKHEYLGSFTNEDDAGRAYNEKAKQLFGEFAYINKIEADEKETRQNV